MACLAKIKCFVSCFVLAYAVYLLGYKCPKLAETPFEHGVQSVFHPLAHTHNQLCDGLNKGVNFLTPYYEQAHAAVTSHSLYKDYTVQEKVDVASTYYQTYAEQYVLQVFQVIEHYEELLVAQILILWGKIQHLYFTEVAPKIKLA